jgi:hypothetical protein
MFDSPQPVLHVASAAAAVGCLRMNPAFAGITMPKREDHET